MPRSRWLALGALLGAATAAQLCWIHERRDRFILPPYHHAFVSFHAEVPPGDEVHVLDHSFRILGASLTIREAFQTHDGRTVRTERDWFLPLPALAGLLTLLPALVGAFVGGQLDRIPWRVSGSGPGRLSRRTTAFCAGLTLISSGIAAWHASTDVRPPAEAARQALITLRSSWGLAPRALAEAMTDAAASRPYRGYRFAQVPAGPGLPDSKGNNDGRALLAWPAQSGTEDDVLLSYDRWIFARRLPGGAPPKDLPSEEELRSYWRELPGE